MTAPQQPDQQPSAPGRAAPAADPATDAPRDPSPQAKVDLPESQAQSGGRLPHERDQSPDSQNPTSAPEDRQIGQAAHADVAQGKPDTGMKPVFERMERQQGNNR